MTTASLLFGTDVQGRNAYAPTITNLKYIAFISQNAAATITLPVETGIQNYEVCFSYSSGSNIFVDCSGATAVSPINTTLALSTVEYCPGQRLLPSGSTVSIITPDSSGAYVGVAIYAKAN